jgi:hypothetical protein
MLNILVIILFNDKHKLFKQEMMKRIQKNFKRLSVKQIKTYAAILLMSLLSFEAFASGTEEGMNMVQGMDTSYETIIDTELSLENWMMLPFESGVKEKATRNAMESAAYEAGFEEEMVLENWMMVPFKAHKLEEAVTDFSTCISAP